MGNVDACKRTPDQNAAHDFLAELRTRISVQPLPYQAGIEASALESLWQLFAYAREAIQKYPGCSSFAHDVADMLNVNVRPVTAKWHRAHAEGRLNSRDGADEFRQDLAELRKVLRKFAEHLHYLAYSSELADQPTPPVMSEHELDRCFDPMPFGIAADRFVPASKTAAINADERGEVDRRRERFGIDRDGQDAVGLALSGGGIRSATFCLGGVQVLAQRDLLKGVDFLSTVSGGGYTGSFLSSRLGNGEASSAVANPAGPDPDAVRYLRQNAKYLSASDLKKRWAMAVSVLAGMLLNWCGLLALIAGAALAAQIFVHYFGRPPWQSLVIGSAAATGIALCFYGWRLSSGSRDEIWPPRLLGGLAALTSALVACWLIHVGYDLATRTLLPHWKSITVGGSIIAAAPTVLRIVPVLRRPTVRRIALRALLVLAGIVLPLMALTAFYIMLGLAWQPLLAIAIVASLTAATLNINLTGPHRLYRDHLGKTFVDRSELDQGKPIPLKDLNPEGLAPYHLINTTVNLPSSTSATLRDRKGDFFLFSKHWCGAPAIGYMRTGDWRMNRHEPDLATAMAVSGAAFSSHMGLASMPTLSALLAFLNVRLGFWIRNPEQRSYFETPGLNHLLREMTGVGMSEKEPWLNLSDGGHIENMAVYELLRRRCKFIISIDGEADPKCSFHGHLTLVRHAQIDLGIRIDSTLEDLRPSPASKFSKTHYMFCRIRYPDEAGKPGTLGLLLYIKLSVTGNEAELIKRYHLLHPDFPHQSTLDQFFDEEQFEAYRQLGAHVMESLFSKPLVGDTQPATVRGWFRGLACSLLQPVEPTSKRTGEQLSETSASDAR
ncbi:patatin-like phospholipase family protein [Bosea sp. NPDC003192]|uniref:patatin-like phospholipase family protein n=1 Tax=Bosea sp. NPDC003192 TaxID=3390551 RepID=UPI003D001E3B